MVKVLGFDVGIKNLAYCIVEKIDDKFVIPDHKNNWDIINLTEQNKLQCAYEKCTNQIGYCCDINKLSYHFCSKHKLYHKIILSNNPCVFQECQNHELQQKCSHAPSCKTKSKYTNPDTGLAICSKHKEIIEKNLNKSRTLIKYKTFVKDFTIHDLKLSLLEKLDTFKNIFLNVDIVCIENQPTFKNPTMKAISDTLYTWFMIRGIVDKDINNPQINKIRFIISNK